LTNFLCREVPKSILPSDLGGEGGEFSNEEAGAAIDDMMENGFFDAVAKFDKVEKGEEEEEEFDRNGDGNMFNGE